MYTEVSSFREGCVWNRDVLISGEWNRGFHYIGFICTMLTAEVYDIPLISDPVIG